VIDASTFSAIGTANSFGFVAGAGTVSVRDSIISAATRSVTASGSAIVRVSNTGLTGPQLAISGGTIVCFHGYDAVTLTAVC